MLFVCAVLDLACKICCESNNGKCEPAKTNGSVFDEEDGMPCVIQEDTGQCVQVHYKLCNFIFEFYSKAFEIQSRCLKFKSKSILTIISNLIHFLYTSLIFLVNHPGFLLRLRVSLLYI